MWDYGSLAWKFDVWNCVCDAVWEFDLSLEASLRLWLLASRTEPTNRIAKTQISVLFGSGALTTTLPQQGTDEQKKMNGPNITLGAVKRPCSGLDRLVECASVFIDISVEKCIHQKISSTDIHTRCKWFGSLLMKEYIIHQSTQPFSAQNSRSGNQYVLSICFFSCANIILFLIWRNY